MLYVNRIVVLQHLFLGSKVRPDQKGGDTFEAYVLKCHGGNRAQALAEVCREMMAQAERELMSAVRSDQGVPGWVAEIMSLVGWTRYQALIPFPVFHDQDSYRNSGS